jgi:hypothetical protein
MEHSLGSGVRRIVHATFVRRDEPGAGRRPACVKIMRRAGLKPEFLCYPLSPAQRPIVRRLIKRFIRARGCPEAVAGRPGILAPVCVHPGLGWVRAKGAGPLTEKLHEWRTALLWKAP